MFTAFIKRSSVFEILFVIILKFSFCDLLNGQEKHYLNIEDVVELTLVNNKDILISKNRINESSGDVQIGRSKFNSTFIFEISKNYLIIPNTIDLRENLIGKGIVPYNSSDILNANFEINKKFRSGIVITPGFSLYNYGKDSLYYRLKNTGYGGFMTNRSDVYLNIKQPLLLGSGKDYNSYEENIAYKQYRISELSHYHTEAYKVFLSITSFLNFISANKTLEIQTETGLRYKALLDQLGYLVQMDAIPNADLTYVRAVIASQNANLKEAEYNFYSRKKELGIFIGIDDKQLKKLPPPPSDFQISELPLFDTSGYLARSFRESLLNRNDINATNYSLEEMELNIEHTKKSIKQELNLKMGIGYNGIFESTGYEQMYKPFYQNIPGINYNVGLSLVINPKHDKEKGELVKFIAGKEIAAANRSLLITEMNANIEDCYKRIFGYNQIVADYRTAVNYNKEALSNEYTKLKLGTSTIINLIQLQINYNDALTNLYDAILKLNLNIITFRFLTGTLINVNKDSIMTIYYKDLFSFPLFN